MGPFESHDKARPRQANWLVGKPRTQRVSWPVCALHYVRFPVDYRRPRLIERVTAVSNPPPPPRRPAHVRLAVTAWASEPECFVPGIGVQNDFRGVAVRPCLRRG